MLQAGQQFPEFSLQDQDGKTWTNADLTGPTVIYFYPKDDTPGCTMEACAFRDAAPQLGDVRVIGVSPDSIKKHQRFIAKFNLNFTLLADPEHSLIEACGLWVQKSMFGKKYMGVDRTTYLVDGSGKIIKIWEKVNPLGHERAVLDAIGNL